MHNLEYMSFWLVFQYCFVPILGIHRVDVTQRVSIKPSVECLYQPCFYFTDNVYSSSKFHCHVGYLTGPLQMLVKQYPELFDRASWNQHFSIKFDFDHVVNFWLWTSEQYKLNLMNVKTYLHGDSGIGFFYHLVFLASICRHQLVRVIFVSSAKRQVLLLLRHLWRSFMYKRGPGTEPCSTPAKISVVLDLWFPIETNCVLSLSCVLNHLFGISVTPQCSGFLSKTSWSAV